MFPSPAMIIKARKVDSNMDMGLKATDEIGDIIIRFKKVVCGPTTVIA